MLHDDYLEKLYKYVGKKIKMSVDENVVSIYVDAEIMYSLKRTGQQFKLLMKERGHETKLVEYKTEREMKIGFSLWLKNLFGGGFEYPNVDEFEDVKNISVLDELMKMYSNEDFYSIGKIKEDKIVLIENQKERYDLFFVSRSGKMYFFEENEEAPFVFERFYTEVVFYREMLRRLETYELVFEEKLEYDSRIQLLGYE